MSANQGPLWLLAELTYACPLQCPYCSNPLELGRRRDELDTDDWLRVLREARALGAVQLGFSGGEPCLRPDLETLVAEGRKLGYYTNLITSSVGLDADRIARLRESGLDHIQISFQAGEPILNDRIAGTRSFEHKRAMAREVKAQGFPMVLNFVLYRDNISSVERILCFASELQADQVELANTQYYGWALLNRDRLLPSRAQIAEAEQVVERFRREHPSTMRVIFVTPDYYAARPKACMNGWGTTFLSVAPDGAALPCQAARQLPGIEFPNVREHSVAAIWRESDAFNRYRGYEWMRSPCRTCPEREKDFGGCRCQAYMLTGEAENADPVCTLSPHRAVIDDVLSQQSQTSGQADVSFIYRSPNSARRLASR